LLVPGVPSFAAAGDLAAQQPVVAGETTPRVFVDCSARRCNTQEFRTEIRFVDWVNEAAAADVHVIITSSSTAGGQVYLLDFIGLGEREGLDDQLRFSTPETDTTDERVRGLTQTLRLGLVRYLVHAGLGDRLLVSPADTDVAAGEPGATGTEPGVDPWNAWVFRIDFETEIEGEERESEREVGGGIGASRTTEDWKIDIELEGDSRRRSVTLRDGDVFTSRTDDWEFASLVVRSAGPRMGLGSITELGSSTSTNRRFYARTAAAVEWNLYPFAEANRRRLIAQLQLGISRVGYDERTIFERHWETLGDQLASIRFETRQPWGDASAGAQFSSYLHDFSLNRMAVNAGLSFRVFRGLNLTIDGSYERIRDQIYLSAEGLSDEEILVRQREQATGYSYDFSVGFSYRFGSIFSNVVNNRFPSNVQFF
jgi:hypothetical protein